MPLRRLFVALSVSLGVATAASLHSFAQEPSAPLRPSGHYGQGHAVNHDWYKELKQPGTGYSCCNGTTDGREGDCRPTRAYLTEEGTWKALVDGEWVPVPPRVVLKQLAPDGNSHICASRSGLIYCFLGGSPKS
jgi:hypothetical protein